MSNNEVGKRQIIAYGMGDFANQLSWAMIGSYLTVFYLDVFGLAPAVIATLMLVARIWDGINDPIMGGIIEKTDTKWGKFRPYILIGAPLLVVSTIFTFTVPDLSGNAKIFYAYFTYICLGMAYTIISVPLKALPGVMTTDRQKVTKLYTAAITGMILGMILLNLFTLPLIEKLGNGVAADGYQKTAMVYAFLALPMYLFVFLSCKENIKPAKKEKTSFIKGLREVFKNRNLVMVILYTVISMTGFFARLGIAVMYYVNCVGNFAGVTIMGKATMFTMITIFMMWPMFVGALIMPVTPKIINKIGHKKTANIAMCLQALGAFLIFVGPQQSTPYLLFALTIYGLGYIGGPCGSGMIVNSVNAYDAEHGVRYDGIAFATNGLGTKIATALGGAIGVALIGFFGYQAGAEITDQVKFGINFTTNLLPAILFLLSLIPLNLYNLNHEKMDEVHRILKERNNNN